MSDPESDSDDDVELLDAPPAKRVKFEDEAAVCPPSVSLGLEIPPLRRE
jgi:hypothetical protein